jgi:hypothetical protein
MSNVYSVNAKAGVTVSVTAANTQQALSGYDTVRQVKLTNAGTKVCFVRFGPVAQTAVTTDFCVNAAESVVVSLPGGTLHMAAICPGSDTTTLYVSPCYLS